GSTRIPSDAAATGAAMKSVALCFAAESCPLLGATPLIAKSADPASKSCRPMNEPVGVYDSAIGDFAVASWLCHGTISSNVLHAPWPRRFTNGGAGAVAACPDPDGTNIVATKPAAAAAQSRRTIDWRPLMIAASFDEGSS